MAQTKTLQRRIRSVKNAGQITKALEVVAASRMRKISSYVEKSRMYAELAASIMRRIAPSEEAKLSPYFRPNDAKAKLYVVFNSDRGQAGAFNSNIFNAVNNAALEDRQKGLSVSAVVFGRKGTHHFSRISDIDMVGAYEDVPDLPEANYFASVLELIKRYGDGEFAGVDIFYTKFVSSLSQQAKRVQLLPIAPEEIEAAKEEEGPVKVFEFEPDIEAVLDEGLRLYFESKIMQARIESATSEYAMRMVAMGNANRNASDLVDSLTLEMNSLRQAAITQEIAEITGGSEALAV
ncbi:MAG: atpG [Candidatus Saccharibacteria bacterium]|nr:atpG [Candidatus Saccharibacteria bacterium]